MKYSNLSIEICNHSRSPWKQSHWIELENTFLMVYNSIHITYKLTKLWWLQNSILCKNQQKTNKKPTKNQQKKRNNHYLGAFDAGNNVVD